MSQLGVLTRQFDEVASVPRAAVNQGLCWPHLLRDGMDGSLNPPWFIGSERASMDKAETVLHPSRSSVTRAVVSDVDVLPDRLSAVPHPDDKPSPLPNIHSGDLVGQCRYAFSLRRSLVPCACAHEDDIDGVENARMLRRHATNGQLQQHHAWADDITLFRSGQIVDDVMVNGRDGR